MAVLLGLQSGEPTRLREALDIDEAKRLMEEQRAFLAEQKEQKEAEKQEEPTKSEDDSLFKEFIRMQLKQQNTTQKPPWDYNWDR
jgi:hypothetical protein